MIDLSDVPLYFPKRYEDKEKQKKVIGYAITAFENVNYEDAVPIMLNTFTQAFYKTFEEADYHLRRNELRFDCNCDYRYAVIQEIRSGYINDGMKKFYTLHHWFGQNNNMDFYTFEPLVDSEAERLKLQSLKWIGF